MNLELYAKVKKSASYCRDLEVRKRVNLFLEVIRCENVELVCKKMGGPSIQLLPMVEAISK